MAISGGMYSASISGAEFAAAGALDLGDRQHLEARVRLRRQQQPRVEREKIDFFLVAAVGLVLHACSWRANSGSRAQCGSGRRSTRPSLSRGVAKNTRTFDSWSKASVSSALSMSMPVIAVAHVEPIGLLADFQVDDRAVLHAGAARIDLKLVVGDRLFADRRRAQAVVIRMVELLRNFGQLGPIAVGRLKVLRPQEHPLVPEDGQISHEAVSESLGLKIECPEKSKSRPQPGAQLRRLGGRHGIFRSLANCSG